LVVENSKFKIAHPAKFPQEMKQILNIEPEASSFLKNVMNKSENIDIISTKYQDFKNYLLKNCIL
jgi:hypothetical protein